MAINPKYIPFYNLNEVFLDKASGLPLSGGVVTFWQDNQRGTMKDVYQITGTDPTYDFIELTNPLVLSSTGTFVDSLGNPVVVYGYPYQRGSFPAVEERYYVTVVSAEGVAQETIEATPYIPDSGSSSTNLTNAENSLSNAQFSEVLFEGNGPAVYSVMGTNTVTPVAPDWDLITTGTGAVSVTRITSIGASSPANPIYALRIATTGITGTYKLRQRLTNTPRIFGGGFVSAYFVASVSSGSSVNVVMSLTQSSGTSYELLNENVSSGAGFLAFADTKEIAQTGAAESVGGYTDVALQIDVDTVISVSCIQLAGVSSATDVLGFNQQTEAEDINTLFHYYKPQLEYKPIPSYLVGWDFPMNPSQFHSTTWTSGQFNIGANKSQYIWDQTIAFQTVDQGLSVARTSAGALEITAALDTQAALIQYLDQAQARELLTGNMAVNISAVATGGTAVSVSLWYTTDVNLPSVIAATNNSIVLTVDANGVPLTKNGTWVQIARADPGVAKATMTTVLADYMFSGWTTAAVGSTTATYFAIVVGTDEMTTADVLTIDSIGLMKGDIATRPAPKTQGETMVDCNRYYQKSFANSVVPANNAGQANASSGPQGGSASVAATCGPQVMYRVEMRVAPTVTLYNPTAGAASQIANLGTGTSWTSTSVLTSGAQGFIATGTPPGGSVTGNVAVVHWVGDARLGIVN